MRKVILGVAISLDGFIEGPNGEYDWCFTDQDYGMTEFLESIDAIVMGRKSYEMMKSFEGPVPWKDKKTFVFSKTLSAVSSDAEILSGDLFETVVALKAQPGKSIWLFGGASLTASFMNAGLIDEYWLALHPIVLGKGKPLFENIESRKKLLLIDHEVYNTGLISLRYQTVH